MLIINPQQQHNRILEVYTKNVKDPLYVEQMRILANDQPGLKERDLVTEPKVSTKNKFELVLIGKDGGEKFRSHEVITLKHLYAMIDAMPMRQQEMKSR